jgi:hypothetical protein
MTNSKLVPKNTNFSKKYQIIQKSINFPKKPKNHCTILQTKQKFMPQKIRLLGGGAGAYF